MLATSIVIQYCYQYLVNQISLGLLLYAHVPTAILALGFGGFVVWHARTRASLYLLLVCASFAGWCFLDIISWFAFLGDSLMMFAWVLVDLSAALMFVFSYFFVWTFIWKTEPPFLQKLIGFGLVSPLAFWIAEGKTLAGFDANICEAVENNTHTFYLYYLEGFVLVSVLCLLIYQYIHTRESALKRQVALVGTGVTLFLTFFLSSTLGTKLLINDSVVEFAYNYEIYGLFGMPILLGYLGFLIVRYKAFDIKVFGAQALIMALIALVGSEFAFISSFVNRILVAITLVVIGVVGIALIRSVRKEIEQREMIERQEKQLEAANKQQESLLHFISHEVKGYLTKGQGAFAEIVAGSFGEPTPEIKTISQSALVEMRKGVDTVMYILKAADFKKGTVAYEKKPFDLKALVVETVESFKAKAEEKHLSLSLSVGDGDFTLTGDREKIAQHVTRNLVENSLNYTPSGSIQVSLEHVGNTMRFTVQDTGVGITPEDMQRLFTQGGHGADSIKVNVHSTGYGLFIAKQVVEAHGGKIWAESEGKGKGSRFVVEFTP